MMFFILAASIAQAQTQEEFLQALEDRFDQTQRDQTPAPSLRSKNLPPHRPVPMEDIVTSKVVQRALVPKGGIQNIKTKEVSVIRRPGFVNVYERTDERGFFYIVEKDGLPKYRVQAKHAEDVRDDIAMYEEPLNFVETTERLNLSPHDEKLGWAAELSAGYARMDAAWTSDLLEADSTAGANAYFVEGHSLVDVMRTFQVGATIRYEEAKHDLTGGEASYQNLSFGLITKSKTLHWAGIDSRFVAQVRMGPLATLEIKTPQTSDTVKLRTTDLSVAWENPHTNRFGELSWGVFWQRQWVDIRDQKRFTRLDTSNNTNDSYGLHLTQSFTW